MRFVFIFSLFFLKAFYTLDPDFGWHIRMGELILSSGIPALDPFSYTMPSFPFVDHEWGINVIIFEIYKIFGWSLTALLFSFIPLISVYISLGSKTQKYLFFPFILSSGSLLFFSGIRPQVVTWFLFSLLTFLLFNEKKYLKIRKFLPLFFLLWANFHGGFPIGLVLLGIFLFVKTIKTRKIFFLDFVILMCSILITLLNPYGIRLWGEIYMQLSDSSLRWAIAEWRPAIFSFYPSLLALFAFSFSFILVFRKQFSLFEKLSYFLFLILGISSIRHVPFFAILAGPVLLKGIIFLSKKASKIKYGEKRLTKAYYFCLVFGVILVLLPFVVSGDSSFKLNEKNFYPKEAVNYLNKHPLKGQVFSTYGWGGYLIWKLPSKKVFIDGRMPSWRWDKEIEGESKYAFKDYSSLEEKGKKFEATARKYNIDTILLPLPQKEGEVDKVTIWVLEKLNKNINKGENFYKKIEKEGWKIIYKDSKAIIYRK